MIKMSVSHDSLLSVSWPDVLISYYLTHICSACAANLFLPWGKGPLKNWSMIKLHEDVYLIFQEGEIAALPFLLSEERLNKVNFTEPFDNNHIAFLTYAPDNSYGEFLFLQPFALSVGFLY